MKTAKSKNCKKQKPFKPSPMGWKLSRNKIKETRFSRAKEEFDENCIKNQTFT